MEVIIIQDYYHAPYEHRERERENHFTRCAMARREGTIRRTNDYAGRCLIALLKVRRRLETRSEFAGTEAIGAIRKARCAIILAAISAPGETSKPRIITHE